MLFRMLSGERYNSLTRMATAGTADPSMLTLFPLANAHDDRASKPAIFEVGQADSTLTFDLTLLTNGTFEADATGWTVLGEGTISSSATAPFAGSASALLELAGGAAEAIAYQDVIVRAGEELTFYAAVKNAASADSAHIRIRNRETGKWLDESQAWSATLANAYANTTTAWEEAEVTFTVESIASCKADTVTLRFYLHGDSESYFDNVSLWPSTNWCSIHGHNIPPFIVLTLESSDDGTSWATVETMTILRDSFHVDLDPTSTSRYWRLLFTGTPDVDSLMFVGEIVLGQSFELLHNPQYGGGIARNDRQTRSESDIGDEFIQLHNRFPQRALSFTFGFKTDEEYEQFRDLIFRRSRGGAVPIVVVPYDLDPTVVIMGRIRETSSVIKSAFYPRSGELEIIEAPLPNTPEIAYAYDAPIEGGG
jgi:hypothetical protein